MTPTQLDTLKERLTYDIKGYEKETKKFAERLLENPAYAMEWSQDMFQTAGRLHVARTVLVWIAKGNVNLRDQVTRLVVDGARFPASSSSPPSNLMHLQVVAAYGRFLSEFL